MKRELLKSKIHRATVTQADLHYIGSITLDPDLMEKADILPHEKVDVVVLNNGARWTTYALPGPRGSGVIGINGPTTRLALPGDLVIIMAYAGVTEEETKTHEPRVLFVDGSNKIIHEGTDPAAAPEGTGTFRGDQLKEPHPSAPHPAAR
ncbi:aspartate 1-decarboxylase [Streptomyces sp. 11x1]|uniref:aspartate 1-decarboxylase n=1 Tax=Streptomyces sp. 11x1 TaxID=3038642 RepID=UPI00161BDD75|nr:aspartate 1-decarboxylase [Streptomyces sp. 11x1]WNZ13647.1 aspartate 1-decarboxylase [Streptomyces sp. 11x1]